MPNPRSNPWPTPAVLDLWRDAKGCGTSLLCGGVVPRRGPKSPSKGPDLQAFGRKHRSKYQQKYQHRGWLTDSRSGSVSTKRSGASVGHTAPALHRHRKRASEKVRPSIQRLVGAMEWRTTSALYSKSVIRGKSRGGRKSPTPTTRYNRLRVVANPTWAPRRSSGRTRRHRKYSSASMKTVATPPIAYMLAITNRTVA